MVNSECKANIDGTCRTHSTDDDPSSILWGLMPDGEFFYGCSAADPHPVVIHPEGSASQ